MSVILRTKAWQAMPPPPDMPGVPFELIMAPQAAFAARLLAVLGKPAGITALAGVGPQVVLSSGIYLGASGIRHIYLVGSTHRERLTQHKVNVAQWLASLPRVRNEHADSLAEIENFRSQFRKGEFGVGSTIEIHGSVGRDFAETYQAACDLMKGHDKYHDLKTIPFLIHDMFKLLELLTSKTSLVLEAVSQFHKVRKKLSKYLNHMHNEVWDDRKYVSFVMAELVLEFVVNGAYVVENNGQKIIVSYGVERTHH